MRTHQAEVSPPVKSLQNLEFGSQLTVSSGDNRERKNKRSEEENLIASVKMKEGSQF